jgi:hypothetical protein
MAVLWATGDNLFPPFQMLGQRLSARMVWTGLLGVGQTDWFFGLRALGFLVNLPGAQAHFVQEQGQLPRRKLFGLGPEDPEMEQADLFVFKLDDALEADDLRLQVRQNLGGIQSRGSGHHLMQDIIIYYYICQSFIESF